MEGDDHNDMDYLLQKPQSNISSLLGEAERGSYQIKQNARKDKKERRPSTPGRRRTSTASAVGTDVSGTAKESQSRRSRRLGSLQQNGEKEAEKEAEEAASVDDQAGRRASAAGRREPPQPQPQPQPQQRRLRDPARRRGTGSSSRSSVADGSVMGGTSIGGSVFGGGEDAVEAFDAEKHAGEWQSADVEKLRSIRKLNAEAAATTQEMVGSLNDFDHKLTDLEQLMKPIQDETVLLKNAHSNITVGGQPLLPPLPARACSLCDVGLAVTVSISAVSREWTSSWRTSTLPQKRYRTSSS
eukprot:COSAG05_NODE_676_length_7987_cov_3.066041_7_plen_299_part_00